MTKILSAGFAVAALLLVFAGQVSAQVVESRRMQSEETDSPVVPMPPVVATTTDSVFYETSPDDGIVRKNDLFTMEFTTGVVFRATCQHIERFDPCLQFPILLQDPELTSVLTGRTRDLLQEMLNDREIIEQLEQLTIEKIRERAREQSGIQGPARRTFLLGAVMFAGGGVLSASKNEWKIDEGYVGAAIATTGLYLMLKPLVARWRGGTVNASRTGLAIGW